ncbi:hypothetical protein NN561_010922 [Cricetulus griseus]
MRSCQASSKKASSVRESPLQKTPYGVAAAGPTALSARADGTSAGPMARSQPAERLRRCVRPRARSAGGLDDVAPAADCTGALPPAAPSLLAPGCAGSAPSCPPAGEGPPPPPPPPPPVM